MEGKLDVSGGDSDLTILRSLETLEGKGYKILEDHCSDLFKDKCEPSTVFTRQVGNIYTGSLYLGLASYLSNSVERIDEVIIL